MVNEKGGIRKNEGKLRWGLLPFHAFTEVVEVLEFGMRKYAKDNWKLLDAETAAESFLRHMVKWQMGEEFDPESGLSHLAHMMCNGMFMLYFREMERGKPDPEEPKKQ